MEKCQKLGMKSHITIFKLFTSQSFKNTKKEKGSYQKKEGRKER